jgi:hypothetical protein
MYTLVCIEYLYIISGITRHRSKFTSVLVPISKPVVEIRKYGGWMVDVSLEHRR